MIFIDISSFMATNVLTGIQRTVIEISSKLISNRNDVSLIYYKTRENAFYLVDSDSFMKFCYSPNRMGNIKITHKNIDIESLDRNSIFLDIDSVWDFLSCYPRTALYRKLCKNKVTIISMIYDLLPIQFPDLFVGSQKSFLLYIAAITKYSSLILTNSNAIRDQYLEFFNGCNEHNLLKKIHVLPLGSNLKNDYDIRRIPENILSVTNRRFLLMVSTLEPRKNHNLLINAFDELSKDNDINLVLVGRAGWSCEDLIRRIRSHRLYKKRLFWFTSANNDAVIYLYKKAFATVLPSLAEGYGLPIVESLFYGCPSFASDIPVFREVSKNNAILFDNKDYLDLVKKITPYLHSEKLYKNAREKIKKFTIISWDKTYEVLTAILDEFSKND